HGLVDPNGFPRLQRRRCAVKMPRGFGHHEDYIYLGIVGEFSFIFIDPVNLNPLRETLTSHRVDICDGRQLMLGMVGKMLTQGKRLIPRRYTGESDLHGYVPSQSL